MNPNEYYRNWHRQTNKKYEYVSKDIDTYIISGDDIDLSHEGFIVKQKNYHDDII